MIKSESSPYINEERRSYSLYILQHRSIPSLCDGLKAAARRVLWTARSGHKYKSSTLAGAAMPIHPHAMPEGAINTLAAPFGNNIPLLDGIGAFGTLLNPTAYGAGRYTSVMMSEFSKDVLFKDIEIVPMVDNYDGTLQEPLYFLPLIPLILLNSSEGIAVGFASMILPRALDDIIQCQLHYLSGKKVKEPNPISMPTNQQAEDREYNDTKWIFKGKIERKGYTSIVVINLPYGMSHEKFCDILFKLKDEEDISDFLDSSKDSINIEIKFKNGVLQNLSDDDILKKLNLISSINENMNVLDFDGQKILSTNFVDIIALFTDWRLGWYKNRYERLLILLQEEIEKYEDVLIAIKNNVASMARKHKSRIEFKQYLETLTIKNVDYIADLPVYRFTEEEKIKIEDKIKFALQQEKEYNDLIKNPELRKNVYKEELDVILKNYKKGKYSHE